MPNKDGYGRPMTMDEFVELVAHIQAQHRWPFGGRNIKYIRPAFDTRTGVFYGIQFDGFEKTEFYLVNENRHHDLRQWIYDWLNSATSRSD